MTSGATIDDLNDGDLLDRLVPGAMSPVRRCGIWVMFLAPVVGATWMFTSGTATPRLSDTHVTGYGGAGPVQLSVEMTNGSRVAIEVLGGPRARAGLTLLGYTHSSESRSYIRDPFPIRMEPRETLNLTTWYAVTDCAQITRTDVDDTDVDLQVRIADGPIASITRTRTIHADGGLSGDEGTIAEGRVDAPWPVVISQYACPVS